MKSETGLEVVSGNSGHAIKQRMINIRCNQKMDSAKSGGQTPSTR